MEGHLGMDAVWRRLGTWGRYQIFQACVLLYGYFTLAFPIFSPVFTGYVPKYECAREVADDKNLTTNLTYSFGSCEINVYSKVGNRSQHVRSEECTRGYHYFVEPETTYAAEWDLVCSKSHLVSIAQSCVLAGQGIGAFIFSHLSDRFGRKTIDVISHISMLVVCSAMALSPNIFVLCALTLVAGTLQQGGVCSTHILLLEMLPRERRGYVSGMTFMAWSIGIVVLGLLAYFFDGLNWRYLQLFLAGNSLIGFIQWWTIDESPRWLLANGKLEEDEKILQKAAKWNRVDFETIKSALPQYRLPTSLPLLNAGTFPESPGSLKPSKRDLEDVHQQLDVVGDNNRSEFESNGACLTSQNVKLDAVKSSSLDGDISNNMKPSAQLMKENHECCDENGEDSTLKTSTTTGSEQSSNRVARFTILDILKDSKMRINTFILWYAWLTASLSYFGLILMSSHLAGSRFVNFSLSGLVEIPAPLLLMYLFNRLGRKRTLIICYVGTTVALISCAIVLVAFEQTQATSIIANGLNLLGKMAATGAFCAVFQYTPEIYPTNFRNSGLGTSSAISRLGSIFAPFVSNLAVIALWIPAVMFGSMSMLVAILALKLPESKWHELPDTIMDVDRWNDKQDGKEGGQNETARTEEF